MTYIDKTASINNIRLMYNACKGILRVKQAGSFEDFFGKKPTGKKKAPVKPLRDELIANRYTDFANVYGTSPTTSNADFTDFMNKVFLNQPLDMASSSYVKPGMDEILRKLGPDATFGNIFDFYDKYRKNNLYRPEWLTGREYDGSRSAKKGVVYDKYLKKFTTGLGSVTGDATLRSLPEIERLAFLSNIKADDKTPGKQKYNRLLKFLQYTPDVSLKDLAHIYYEPEYRAYLDRRAKHPILKGNELDIPDPSDPSKKLRGYRPGERVEETGDIAHPLNTKDLDISGATDKGMLDHSWLGRDSVYNPATGNINYIVNSHKLDGIESAWGKAQREAEHGNRSPVYSATDVLKGANRSNDRWNMAAGAVGLGTGCYLLGDLLANTALKKHKILGNIARYGLGAAGAIGGGYLGHQFSNRNRYYE